MEPPSHGWTVPAVDGLQAVPEVAERGMPRFPTGLAFGLHDACRGERVRVRGPELGRRALGAPQRLDPLKRQVERLRGLAPDLADHASPFRRWAAGRRAAADVRQERRGIEPAGQRRGDPRLYIRAAEPFLDEAEGKERDGERRGLRQERRPARVMFDPAPRQLAGDPPGVGGTARQDDGDLLGSGARVDPARAPSRPRGALRRWDGWGRRTGRAQAQPRGRDTRSRCRARDRPPAPRGARTETRTRWRPGRRARTGSGRARARREARRRDQELALERAHVVEPGDLERLQLRLGPRPGARNGRCGAQRVGLVPAAERLQTPFERVERCGESLEPAVAGDGGHEVGGAETRPADLADRGADRPRRPGALGSRVRRVGAPRVRGPRRCRRSERPPRGRSGDRAAPDARRGSGRAAREA